jgi:hypothetical protein
MLPTSYYGVVNIYSKGHIDTDRIRSAASIIYMVRLLLKRGVSLLGAKTIRGLVTTDKFACQHEKFSILSYDNFLNKVEQFRKVSPMQDTAF